MNNNKICNEWMEGIIKMPFTWNFQRIINVITFKNVK